MIRKMWKIVTKTDPEINEETKRFTKKLNPFFL
jgi:hypothetical protein